LDLQDDEVEFTNELFRSLYAKIIERLNRDGTFKVEQFINELGPDESNEISSIILNEEKYLLHRWEDREVYVKTKDKSIAQLVSETILSLRGFLISKKIKDLSSTISAENNNREILSDIKDYLSLNTLLSQKLGRVFSTKN